MENYIVINGKKAELTEEQLKALGIEIKKNDSFELELGEYFYINNSGEVIEDYNSFGCLTTVDRYKIANYCKDEDLLKQRALHETLNRLLWRYSMQHDGDKIDFDNNTSQKVYIIFNNDNKHFFTSTNTRHSIIGVPYFHTDKVANEAIKEIVIPFLNEHPNFKW